MTLQTFLRRLIWVCMAPLLVLALIVLVVNLRQSQVARNTDLAQHAQLTRQYIDLKIASHARGLNMLATSPELAQAGVSPNFYRTALAFHTHFGDHIVLAHQDRMLMNTRVPLGTPLPPMPQVRGRSAVQEALQTGQLAVGDLFQGPMSKSLLLAMAVPVIGPGRSELTLLTIVEASRFEQRLQEIPLPEGVSALLLDSTGRQIAARGRIDLLASAPPAFGKRLVLPLELVRWTLVFEADGIPEQTALLEDAALWFTALALAAGATYLAARRAGRTLEAGFESLTANSAAPVPPRELEEIARARELLQQLSDQRDQKQAALITSEARAWTLLKVIPDPMVVTREGVIEFANRGACALLGKTQLDGQRLIDFVHPLDRPETMARLASLPRAPGAVDQMLARMLRTDGSTRDVWATVARIELADGLVSLSVLRDVTRENATHKALVYSRAQLRELLEQLVRAQELERKRVALDIHDDLQQTLASLKLSAASLCKADQDGQQALRRELAQAIAEQASQAVQSTRRIIEDLRPQALDHLGLAAALESLMERFERETGVEAFFSLSVPGGVELSVEPGLSITLYRVAQEALNNVRKHAQARTVELLLSQLPEGEVELRVVDDGLGLPPAQATGSPGAGTGGVEAATTATPRSRAEGSGLGLAGMRERMRAVGGTLEMRPAAGGGTELVARAPMGSGPAV